MLRNCVVGAEKCKVYIQREKNGIDHFSLAPKVLSPSHLLSTLQSTFQACGGKTVLCTGSRSQATWTFEKREMASNSRK